MREGVGKAGVTGWPIGHSLSPLLHTAWLEAAGLDATYEALPAETEGHFDALVARGRAGDLRGFNITAPWKERALAAADAVSDTARKAGSVNLLVFEGGKAIGDSTDGLGLMGALAEQAQGLDLAGRPAVVLGAGGASRAAVVALVDAGAEVRIVNRSRDRAEVLVAELGGVVMEAWNALQGAALVVNALSVQPDVDLSLLPDDAAVMDMTYRPLETPFLAAARERGLIGVDGLAMLIGQARPSFRALFGVAPPPVDVRAKALAYLGEAG